MSPDQLLDRIADEIREYAALRPTIYASVKSLSPFIKEGVTEDDIDDWMPREYKQILLSGEHSKEWEVLMSLNSLLHAMRSGQIAPFPGMGINYGRSNFEQALSDMTSFDSPVCPVYAVVVRESNENDEIIREAHEKVGAYGDVTYVFTKAAVLDRSTFILGDSTNIGRLNEEIATIFEDINLGLVGELRCNSDNNEIKRSILEKYLDRAKRKYPDLRFEINGTHILIDNSETLHTILSTSIMSKPYALRVNCLLKWLQEKGFAKLSEYIEAQIYGTVSLDDIDKVMLNEDYEEQWENIKTNIQNGFEKDDPMRKRVMDFIEQKISVENLTQ